MSLPPLPTSVRANYTAGSASRSASIQSQRDAKLNDLRNKVINLSQKIEKVENSILELKENVGRNNRSLTSLHKIESFNNENTSVRLKDGQFKKAEGGGFFKNIINAGRYKQERQDAAQLLGSDTRIISVSDAISVMKGRIETGKETINKLQTEVKQLKEEKSARIDEIYPSLNSPRSSTSSISSTSSTSSTGSNRSTSSTKAIKDFSVLYQSNAGCKALNIEARNQFRNTGIPGSLSGSKVIEEYRKAHGYEVFNRGAKAIKNSISAQAANLTNLVKNSAEAFYTPSSTNITTYRGQGMTSAGLDKLIAQFKQNKDQIYQPGQFFSTSKNVNVANSFANNSNDAEKVLFKIRGNSSRGLSVEGGLSFGNKVTEQESLYSPKANFKIENIYAKNKEGMYTVVLKEVPLTKDTKLLPY